MSKTLDQYRKGYEGLQKSFDGKIKVVPRLSGLVEVRPETVIEKNRKLPEGFVDISAKTEDLRPLHGRVLLSLVRQKGASEYYAPAVLTERAEDDGRCVTEMTRLKQPFDAKTGITSGIKFALGLKVDTRDGSFGSHGESGGYESGHFSPVLLGGINPQIGNEIVTKKDKASHALNKQQNGGIPERMVNEGVMPIAYETRPLPQGVVIPLFWHQGLENEKGLMPAQYDGAVQLMLGAATLKAGPMVIDRVGNLVEHAIAGAK